MNYLDRIGILIAFAVKRYPVIKRTLYNEKDVEERYCEMYTNELVLTECLRHPFKDPEDI